MKRFKICILITILCACEGETILPEKGEKSLQLRAKIEKATGTRATNSSWENNDAIGVFMMQSGKTIEEGGLRNNVKYVTTGSSSFKPVNREEEITFPYDQSEVDFISYYPFQDNLNGHIYPINLENQSKQSSIDLLYSNNARGYSSENPDVDMQFKHQLSKVILKISSKNGVNLSNSAIVLTNAGVCADFDLNTGQLTSATKRGDIQFNVSTNGQSAEAILLPEAITSDMTLWFIIESDNTDKVYQIPLAEALEVESLTKATQYTCNALLSYETVTIGTENNISTWTEKDPVDKTVNRTDDIPPIIKGLKKRPFTVAETIVNPGRTNVWVVGYIVGSFDNSVNKFIPGADGAASTNVALADTPNETDVNKMIPVQLPTLVQLRDELDLNKKPENIGKKVLMRGNIDTYFTVPGLKSVKEYKFP